jgi:hypothetical protein
MEDDMLFKSVSSGVLALSIMTAVGPASAGIYDLGKLTPPSVSYSELASQPTNVRFSDVFASSVPESYSGDFTSTIRNFAVPGPQAVFGSNDDRHSYADLAQRGRGADTTGTERDWPGYRSWFDGQADVATIAMLLAGLGLIVSTARRRTLNR